MLVLALRYLNGWAMAAADGARKEQAEWPPHPDRVFMALAAAWFETGEDPDEGAALRWLESLDPPSVAATGAERRTASRGERPPLSYVPVNDARTSRKAPASSDLDKLTKAGLGMLPQHRSRQPRGFPVAVPHDPLVHLIWPQADPAEHRQALDRLAGKVTHVGHSASLVQAWVTDQPVEATLAPSEGIASHRLRVPSGGRLDYLRARHNRAAVVAHAELVVRAEASTGKAKKRVREEIAERFGATPPVSLRPEPGRWQGYARPVSVEAVAPGTVFDPRIVVLAVTGRRVPLPATLKLTEALRGALLKGCGEQPPPEWFSGHTSDGRPSADPHVALLPLPYVGAEHADGRVMGLGIALPAGLDPAEARRCLGPFLHDETTGQPRITKLFDGRWLECFLTLETRESTPWNLRPRTWTRESRHWASVTPVVLDRHFDGRDKWERAAETVKDACERIGLPRPREVLLHPVSLVEGVPHAREFPAMTRKSDGGRRHHAHAAIVFDEPVQGPLLVGAGRFRGYGLCRPPADRD